MQRQKVGDAGGRAGWLSFGAESLSPSGGLRCRSAETQRGRNLDLHCSIIPKVVVLGLGVIEGGCVGMTRCDRRPLYRTNARWLLAFVCACIHLRAGQSKSPRDPDAIVRHTRLKLPGLPVVPPSTLADPCSSRYRAECAVGTPVAVNSRHLCTAWPCYPRKLQWKGAAPICPLSQWSFISRMASAMRTPPPPSEPAANY